MGESSSASVIEDSRFSMLEGKVDGRILIAIHAMGFEKPTPIQAKALPFLLQGKDVIGAAKTGSGKTLAFLIPMLDLLLKEGFKKSLGTGGIILSPTRELALQTYEVVMKLIGDTDLTSSIIVGGENKNKEVKLLQQGVNIIVGTPGRLFDHLSNTADFNCNNLRCLVIDEADKLLEAGFKRHIVGIVKKIPKKRQTVLFSATIDDKIKNLAQLAMREDPVLVSIIKNEKLATVEGLQQGYCVCPMGDRFSFLYHMLKKTKDKKVMVFFSSCKVINFYHEYFTAHCDAVVTSIHGRLNQVRRKAAYLSFVEAKSGALFCTDVAARGLDIPAVDWIIQFDPPTDTKQYIHRVGRTVRGDSTTGNAVLLLTQEELEFLKLLEKEKAFLDKYDFGFVTGQEQTTLEEVVAKTGYLNILGRKAFVAFIRSYKSYTLKKIFILKNVDLKGLSKSFGLREVPNYLK